MVSTETSWKIVLPAVVLTLAAPLSFAWSVSEAALIFSGFCYNGQDDRGRARWDRFANTRIRRVEFSTNPAELPAHWNTCTGNWLRQCARSARQGSGEGWKAARPAWRGF